MRKSTIVIVMIAIALGLASYLNNETVKGSISPKQYIMSLASYLKDLKKAMKISTPPKQYISAARKGDAEAFRPLLSAVTEANKANIGKMLQALLLEYDITKVAGETLEQRLSRLNAAYDGKLTIIDMLLSSRGIPDAIVSVRIAGEQSAVGVISTLIQQTNGKSNRSAQAAHQFASAVYEKIKATSLLIEMVRIAGGKFRMGLITGSGSQDELPAHAVHVSTFEMSKYEITQAQWLRVMGSNPSGVKGGDLPVEMVSWDDIQNYISKLNTQTGKHYRLPTEAEWEYAARAGTTSRYSFGNDESQLCQYGNGADQSTDYEFRNKKCSDGYGKTTSPVGSFRPNPYGLYDMHGNVWEWVQDCYHENYRGAPADGSAWLAGGCGKRVLRGGSWHGTPDNLRSANRYGDEPDNRDYYSGFRLVQG